MGHQVDRGTARHPFVPGFDEDGLGFVEELEG